MKTALFLMACAAVCVGVALGDIVSTNTRAATEMWVSRRFASTNDLAEAVAPLVNTQQLAAAVAGLASTGYVAQAVAPLPTTQQLSAAVAPLASTQMLAQAIAAIPPASADALRLVTPDATQWIDGTGGVWRVETANSVPAWRVTTAGISEPNTGEEILPPGQYTVAAPVLPLPLSDRYFGDVMFSFSTGAVFVTMTYYMPEGGLQLRAAKVRKIHEEDPPDIEVTLYLQPVLDEDHPFAFDSTGIATYPSSAVAEWGLFGPGVVTNYSDRLATTSYVAAAVETYLMASNAWIEVDFSNRLVSVSVVVGGSTNTVVAGAAGNSIDPAATNLLWLALADAIATRAPKAWGTYAPDGTPNPEPEYGTFMNAPATVFASGSAWGTYGTYAVLTTPGATAYATGQDGAFRIGPDSTNWFGYVTGGSVLVGAVPESLAVFGGGTEGGYAEIVYQYDGGAFPTLWFTASLALDFTVVATAAWTDNMDGTATVSAPATSASGYWRATSTATFGHVFATSMPARFHAGVFGATNATPVVYDSTILITSGGKTYRIPAQLVE